MRKDQDFLSTSSAASAPSPSPPALRQLTASFISPRIIPAADRASRQDACGRVWHRVEHQVPREQVSLRIADSMIALPTFPRTSPLAATVGPLALRAECLPRGAAYMRPLPSALP